MMAIEAGGKPPGPGRDPDATGSPFATRPWMPWLAGLLVGAIGVRALAVAATGPVSRPDTDGYIFFAKSLLSLDLAGDVGMRTPVYPLFMALFGFDAGWVRVAQLALGLGVSVLLFLVAYRFTQSGPLSLAAAAVYGWSPSQVYQENILLTETLSVFLLVSSVAMFAKAVREERPSPWLLLGMGLSAGLAALTRPVLAVLPVVLLAAIVIRRTGWRAIAIVAIAGLGPMLAWSAFNYARLGYFGVTTITGGSLTNHTGAYIDSAPDRYATIKRIYIAGREANGGDHINVIWNTWEEMSAETGESFPQLSQTLTRMSVGLIATHPVLYGKAVARNLGRFWLGTGWMNDDPSSGVIASAGQPVTRVWRVLIAVLSAITLVLASVVFVRAVRAPTVDGSLIALLGVILFVLVTGALAASAVDNDDARRYGLPFLSLIGLLAVLALRGWRSLTPHA